MFRDACGDHPFKELTKLAISFLTLPWSNAEVERLFSQMEQDGKSHGKCNFDHSSRTEKT